jgi:hypothetical protein
MQKLKAENMHEEGRQALVQLLEILIVVDTQQFYPTNTIITWKHLCVRPGLHGWLLISWHPAIGRHKACMCA